MMQVAGMRVGTSKSEAMILSREKGELLYLFQVGNLIVLLAEEGLVCGDPVHQQGQSLLKDH